MKKSFSTLLIICVAFSSFSQSGTLDESFGIGGVVTTDITMLTEYDRAYDVLVLSSGGIMACGYAILDYSPATYSAAVAKYKGDGSLDASFADGGIGNYYFTYERYFAQSMVEQADGKILLCGRVTNASGLVNKGFVIRLLPDGTLDSTFSDYGYTIPTIMGSSNITFYDIQVQDDDKIVVVGSYYSAVTNSDFLVLRLNSDGNLDSTFSSDGYMTIDGISSSDHGFSVLIQMDERIVLSGYGYFGGSYDMMAVRLNSNGMPDTSFGYNGKILIDLTEPGKKHDYAYTSCLQEDGKIILAGHTDPMGGDNFDRAFLRLNTNGFPDSTFGTNGAVIIEECELNDVEDIAVQDDGKILACGTTQCSSIVATSLLRLQMDGSLDSTFGVDGFAPEFYEGYAYAMAVQQNGKILVAGDNFDDFTLARFYAENESCADSGPSGFYADGITTNKAKVHWTAVPDAVKYKLQYRPLGTTTWSALNALSNIKTISGLAANTTYEYRVRSMCTGLVLSPWSSIEEFTTLPLKESAGESYAGIYVYPNPTDGNFRIQFSETPCQAILVKNLDGEILYAEEILADAAQHEIFLQPDIPNGIYIVETVCADEKTAHKLLIAR